MFEPFRRKCSKDWPTCIFVIVSNSKTKPSDLSNRPQKLNIMRERTKWHKRHWEKGAARVRHCRVRRTNKRVLADGHVAVNNETPCSLNFFIFLGGKEPKQYGIRWAGIGFSLAVRRFSTVVVKNNDCAVDPRGIVCCAARSKGYVRVERDGGKEARKKPVNERIVRKRET